MNRRLHTALRATLFVFVCAFVAAPVFAGQQDDIEQLRKRYRQLEKDQARAKTKIADLEKKLAAKKKRLKKKHDRAFDFETQKAVGADIAAWFNANPKADSADDVLAANKDVLVKAFGNEIFVSSKIQLLDLFAAVIEEKQKSKAPTDGKRIGRGLKEGFDQALGKDYDLAFETILKKQTRDWKKLVRMKQNYKSFGIQLDTIRRQQAATVSARIPAGMVPVPKATNVKLGTSFEKLIKISHDLGDSAKRNFLIMWATPPRLISIDEFMIDQFEVTHLAYWYFCHQTGHAMPKYFHAYEDIPGVDENGKKRQKAIWKDVWPNGVVPDEMKYLPVTWVSYDDAVAYCLWTQTRLPTEFEWELAARSGKNGFDHRFWPWGNDYCKETCLDGSTIESDVRKKKSEHMPDDNYIPGVVDVGTMQEGRNPLGLYDMAGSVAEFTSSPFIAYPGYKGEMKTKEGIVSAPNKFNANEIVIRGGHCDNRDVIVSSVFRSSVDHRARRKKFVGFRRARSGVAGKDQLKHIMRNGRLDVRLQEFKLTKPEAKKKWFFPHLDTRKGYYAIAEKFEWNEEYKVPGKGSMILIVNREMKSLSSEKWANKFSKGENDINDSLLIGVLHTDVEIMDPPLKAGTWFVSYKKGRTYKDPERKGKKIVLEDAILFVPLKPGEPTLRVDYTGTEITTQSKKMAGAFKTQVTPLVVDGEGSTYDKLEVTWVFDIKSTGKKAIVELDMKVKKGLLNGFK